MASVSIPRAVTLERLALLQHALARKGKVPWRDAYALVRLTPAVNELIREGLAAFSGRPGVGAEGLVNPDTWAIRVTSRGYDVLPARVRAFLVLSELHQE